MKGRDKRLRAEAARLRRQLRSIREIVERDRREIEDLRAQLRASSAVMDKMVEQIHASAVLIREQSSRELRLTAELCCKGK